MISLAVWSAVALASIALSLEWSASVNTFELEADSTKVLISAAVWSAVAAVSILSNLVLIFDPQGKVRPLDELSRFQGHKLHKRKQAKDQE